MMTRPKTLARHRKQVVRQIYLPFGLGVLLVAAAATGAGWAGLGTAGLWADIALVWLTALMMAAGIVALAVLAVAVAASLWLLRWIPPQAARVQAFVERIPVGVRRGADALVRPVIVLRSVSRALARLWGRRGS